MPIELDVGSSIAADLPREHSDDDIRIATVGVFYVDRKGDVERPIRLWRRYENAGNVMIDGS